MNSGIYCIRNTVTDEKYVGGTTYIPGRKSGHFSDLRKGKHGNKRLQHSCDQHGVDAFTFEILEHCPSSKLGDREMVWCEKLNPEFNMGKAGTGGFPRIDIASRHVVCLTPEIEAAVRRFCEAECLSRLTDGLRSLIVKALRTEGLL